MLYIRLFHGRTDPEQGLDDWGSDGPIFGPYRYVHTTYAYHVKCGRPDDDCDELMCYEDMLYYDGVYYGDWSVFGEEVLVKEGITIERFDEAKAVLPKRHS